MTKFPGLLALPLLLPFLASCAAVDAMNAYAEEQRAAKEAAFFESIKGECSKYGFSPGTDSFAQCVQTEINNVRNRDAIEAAARRTRDAIESAGKQATTENLLSPQPTTTDCVKTVLGVRCTTR